MKNERLLALMEARGVNKNTLSKLTGIAPSTLSRIIENNVKHIKQSHMQSIASVLGTTIHAIFETASENAVLSAIRPDEAGEPLTKLLSPDECFLLFWYQNSLQNGREKIFQCAKSEYEHAVEKIKNRVETRTVRTEDNEISMVQLSLPLDL